MSKKHPLGVDGVDENEYSLPPFTPPKIKTKNDEEKKEPNFLKRLYKRITKKKAL